MTTESPTCMGCFTHHPSVWNNPLWHQMPPMPPIDLKIYSTPVTLPVPPVNLTDEEKLVLTHLALAWAAFSELKGKHPDDDREFQYAIHMAQQKVGMRVARRVDTDVWTQPKE